MAHHSHVISTLVITEKQALTLSLFGCITFAIFGIGYGLFVGSNAIMLDGIFTLFSMGMTGLGLVTCSPPRKMKKVFAKNENPPQR
ncbi:hypothetical protein IIDPJIOB_04259 [Aeromonas veronii]